MQSGWGKDPPSAVKDEITKKYGSPDLTKPDAAPLHYAVLKG